MVAYARSRGISGRRACILLHVARSMCSYCHKKPEKNRVLGEALRSLARQHPSWGYRIIHGYLRERGETSGLGRLRRLWQRIGMAALWRRTHRKIKRGQRIDPLPMVANSVWCMDFSEDRLQNGRRFMSLLVKDEATAYGLEIAVAPSFKADGVVAVLDRLIATYGKPNHLRCDNGGQFIAHATQEWAERNGVRMAYIEPGKPWQNGSAESFVGTYRREVLDAEVFFSLKDAEVLSQRWRRMYNNERPHSRHGYRPPATAYRPDSLTTEPVF